MTPVSRPEMKNGFDSKNRAINNQFLSRPESWWAIWIAVGAFLLYAMALGHGYNMDDELVTRGHKLTSKGFEGLRQIFNSPYYSDDMGYSYEYRPVTLASFAIEHELLVKALESVTSLISSFLELRLLFSSRYYENSSLIMALCFQLLPLCCLLFIRCT
jgi:hypothetical protein